MDRIERQTRVLATPTIKHILWVSEKRNPFVEDCVEEIVYRVYEAVSPNISQTKLDKVIEEKMEDVLWKDTVSDLWFAKVDTYEDSALERDKVKFQEIEVKNIVEPARLQAELKHTTAVSELSKYKLLKVASFTLKRNGFINPVDFFTSDFDKKLNWDYWIFESFSWLFEAVEWKKYSDNISTNDMVSFVAKLDYKRSLAVCLVKLIRISWITQREELEELWAKGFFVKDFSKWITWKFIVEQVLRKDLTKITQTIYEEFLDRIDFDRKTDVADTSEIIRKAQEEWSIITWINQNTFTGWRWKSNKYLNSLSEEELKQKAIEVILNNWYDSVLSMLLFKDGTKVVWNFYPFSTFLNLYNRVISNNTSSRNTNISVQKLSDFLNKLLGWKTLDEEIASLMSDDNIGHIENVSDLFHLELYSELYPEEWKDPLVFTWEDLIRFVLNKSHYANITSTLLVSFFTKIWRKDLIKKYVKEEYKTVIKRPEEFIWVSDKKFFKAVDTILKDNWYKNIFDLFTSKKHLDFSGDFSPFNNFTHLGNCVLNRRLTHSSGFTVIMLVDIANRLWWEDVTKAVRHKVDRERNYKRLWD